MFDAATDLIKKSESTTERPNKRLIHQRLPFYERKESIVGGTKSMGVFVVCVIGLMANNASAISVELAKKCNALTAEAYPPRVIGNPAAGSIKGTGPEIRAYYNKCVLNSGEMPEQKP
jgi:hypothetical protein